MQTDHHKLANWKQLLRLGETLLNQDSIDAQKMMILNTAEEILNCKAEIYFLDSIIKGSEVPKATQLPTPLMLTALEKRQTILGTVFEDTSSSPDLQPAELTEIKAKGIEGVIAVASPLIFHDTTLGVIQLNRMGGPVFSQDELELVEGIATQSAIALHAFGQIHKDRRQITLLSLVRSVSQQIAELLELDDLTRQVTRLIQETFDYYYVAIFTIEPGQEKLRFWHSARQFKVDPHPIGQSGGQTSAASEEFKVDVSLGQGIIGFVAQTGEPIVANDVSHNPHYRALDTLPETKSEAALPLRIENRILGVLDVQSNRENAFQDTDVLVLSALADNIATAVENARLYSDLNRRAEHLSVVAEVSNAITSILDLDDLLREVVRLVHFRLGIPYVNIYSVHTGRRKIFFRAGISRGKYIAPSDEFTVDLDNENHILAQVAREGKARIINPMTNPAGNLVHQQDEINQSILVVPLVFVDEILGVLEVRNDQDRAFGLDDQYLLDALADYIAIAIRNANLFRSEMWRRQVADSMREVAGLLTADAALDQVLELILKELTQTLPCDGAAIWLSDGNATNQNTGQLRLAALHLNLDHLTTGAATENETPLLPSEIIHLLNRTSVPSPWLADALYSAQPKIRKADEPYEPLGAILDFPPNYSAIAAPLKVAGNPLGLLVLIHHTNDRYGHESQAMTETFASYAAVAIENTRLYETAHDQAWISTVLLQVAEATQSLNTLEELLNTMVKITPMLIGVNSCSFFLWDSSSDVFTLAASFGLHEDIDSMVNSLRISLGDVPVFDQMFFAKGPLVVEGKELSDVFQHIDINEKSFVLFPMLSHGEVMGALLVDYDYRIQQEEKLGSYAQEIGWDEKFAIIQGIAHQTAVAVENLRLIKAQQDEAYVSVALLQVAQAVVSLNALDEILEAIVRITPILVGVKRSLIFLWDDDKNVFTLSKSYGLTRTELLSLGEVFHPHEFPLLDAVRNSNSIVFLPIKPETESPLVWKSLDYSSFDILEQDIHELLGAGKSGSDSETFLGKDYLKNQAVLLYGFPLSVKGAVLGVMLTQEMELISGYPSRQVREKRLEITIGITQQAAMAIQNDRLQKDVVERERLEREFQLAREIQETFFPDTLPEYPGWELTSLWRPARQVSGDFYDVIQLSDQQWGLVIADVADKGMPAALYMTLIRSLIRAAIKENNAPSSVLQRVNDLLVADSKSGMFVTLVYAVLSLDNGILQYANAGHNPPVLKQSKGGRLVRLKGTAMALGVFEGIEVRQEQVNIQPGDMLVLYTDGITEAFSPQGVMFGEDGLLNVIRSCGSTDAQSLANAIDQAVIDFTEGNTSSDDITLVVIKRADLTP